MNALALLLCSFAFAQDVSSTEEIAPADPTDGTHLWARQAVAVAGWPAGAISDTRVQVRAPMYRSDSIVFQDTYMGAGARIAATPAFSEVGPRLSIAPIDVFDMDLQASYIRYYGGTGIGLLPMTATEGKLESERADIASVKGDAIRLSAIPTFKIKVGPIIAFDSWTISYTQIAPEKEHTKDLVYEPFNDLVTQWTDITLEQQGAVIYEVIPDEGGVFFWAGATARDRLAVGSKDRSTTAGLVLRARPAKGKGVPTLTGQALMYLNDADRVGHVPSLALLADWQLRKSL
ncbi:MAG: hypothetical protein EP330_08055 [Deltaproteobacteria bacterium]|nr:MAG: hypothetical protein EP330_08055 [Deltaproteobacteria bacterium]